MKKVISILLAAILLTAGTLLYVAAGYFDSAAGGHVCNHGYYTLGDKLLSGGVSGRTYWIDSSLSNVTSPGTSYTYADLVSIAASNWQNTGVQTRIKLTRTTSQTSSTIEISKNTSLGASVGGLTTFWQGSTQKNLDSTGALGANYTRVKIYINTTALNSFITNSQAAQRKATIVHELGHGFGLSHRNNVASSIMCQYGSGRTATVPSTNDCNAINHLYTKPNYK